MIFDFESQISALFDDPFEKQGMPNRKYNFLEMIIEQKSTFSWLQHLGHANGLMY